MMHGYSGRILTIDISSGAQLLETLPDHVFTRFIGGIGLGTYLLYRYSAAGTNPLGSDNPLIFVGSPLTGTRLTTTSKFAIVTKSPLTGFIGDSLSSSHLAIQLKRTGVDAIVITGVAPEWSVLVLDNDYASLEPSTDLLGMTTSETEAEVKQRLPGFRVACIGPAGENLVPYASIANDGGRQAGRTGPGAVMGAKRLKAIAIRGTQPMDLANEDALNTYAANLTEASLGPSTEKYRILGTTANLAVFNRLGVLPTKNFQQATFDEADLLSAESLLSSHNAKNAHCANCTIGCEKILTTINTDQPTSARMEYESLFALGPLVGVSDPDAVVLSANLCDELGMDTISAGSSIAWAMESVDRGLIDHNVKFGDSQMVNELLKQISNRSGLGKLLSKGVRTASDEIGHGSDAWAMHVKGLEMPGYEPRSLKTLALGLAVSTRGACHNRSSAYEADLSTEVDRLGIDDRRGELAAQSEDFSAVLDSMIWCKFLRKAFGDFWVESAQAYEWITGQETSPDDLREAGQRINTLKKLFNIREGWTRADDTLPPRVLQEPLSSAVVEGITLSQADLDKMISSYYEARQWTVDGLVPKQEVKDLQLDDVVQMGRHHIPPKGLNG